ncbi:catalase related subgroup [Trichodelitschia bisporula]|uniref:Catalase related subgroup n=1 Tax=Trichodelitschia bisporula TaxID=703511 RepID=A0A6G1HS71_9PEZI|nr:catalase related subgroup [Trichodelitschia bisporula]
MPLPSDPELVKTAENLLALFHKVFGDHPGYRPAHAKGILLSGTFTPSETAKTLSTAPHFNAPTPILARLSDSTGLPAIPDTVADSRPHGLGLRFDLGGRKHTDIVAHSTPRFPVRTGEEFLGLLTAIATSPPGGAEPSPVQKFVGARPYTQAFLGYPKPALESWAGQEYHGINAFKLISPEGKGTFVRWIVEPEAQVATLSDKEVGAKGADYLREEIAARLGGGKVTWQLKAQVAAEGDVTDDATVVWPAERDVVTLGTIVVDAVVPDGDEKAKTIIFDPIPRVEGVEPSDDPILEFRAGLYLISGRERRKAVADGTSKKE